MDDQTVPAESSDARVQAALREYLERVDRGEAPNRDEFLSKRPEIAQELRSFIDAEDQLRKLGGAKRADEQGSTSTQSFAVHGQETVAPQLGLKRSDDGGGSGLKQEFGRYRIVKALGKGAMGMVYLAEDTQLQRQIALKTPHFEQQPTPELLERFYREARAAATLRHPNICPVYDVGQIEGTHYISMAFIEGHPLSAFIRSKPQPERQILIVVRKLAQALQEAHDLGIVHRDLKPANIMVDKRNEPIIMDFGLARQLQRETNVRITQSGMLIGTPAYMAPEQIEGDLDKVGPPSDQYSLGVILFELLTGQLPFRGSLSAVMAQILTKETTPPSQFRRDLDLRIEAVCLKMMAKDPANRFASLSAVAEEIAAILRNPGGKQTASPDARGQSPVASPDSKILASVVGQSTAKKSLTGAGQAASLAPKDLVSLEELARKCLARHDYDQVIQIIERIPEKKRTAGLAEVMTAARAKTDEIAFLICEIDEAVRCKDHATALRKADELLKIKPGHHHALRLQEDFAGTGTGGAARIGLLRQFQRPWKEGGWIPWSALAFGLAVFGVVAGVIIIVVNKAVVVIDSKDPGIAVSVNGNSALITVPGEQQVNVWPGDQLLTISYAGLETQTKRFSLKRGATEKLKVWIADSKIVARLESEIGALTSDPDKKEVAAGNVGNDSVNKKAVADLSTAGPKDAAPLNAAPATTSPGFVALFNGRDLAGWQKDPIQPGDWHVQNGLLVGGGPSGFSCLYSERSDYMDFRLHVEARITGDASGGLCFRAAIPAEAAPIRLPTTGYKIELFEPKDPHTPRTGSVGGLGSGPDGPTQTGFKYFEPHVTPGQWFTVDVLAEGRHTVVRVNGKVTVDNNWIKKQYPPGRIALVQDLGKPSVEYRKIQIQELGSEPATDHGEAVQPLADFVPLFNGRDLSGWKVHPSQPGKWRVVDGVLIGSGNGPSHLYTDRDDFRDFHLRVEARINRGGNSGIMGRASFGPKWPPNKRLWPLAYEGQIYLGPSGAQTGSLYLADQGAVVWVGVSPIAADEWFTEELIVEGNKISVTVNGKTTADWVDTLRPLDRGHIALQHHDSQTIVEFRKVEVRELGAAAPIGGAPHQGDDGILIAPFDESAAKSAQQVWSERLKMPVEVVNSIGMRLRLVPPGKFRMGSRRHENEEPEHDVEITQPMFVGACEVTKGEFLKFESASGYKTRSEKTNGAWQIENSVKARKWYSSRKRTLLDPGFPQEPNHPVVVITWDDAQAFCVWLSNKESRLYRLPTEAEWEYACRAGTTGPAYNGSGEESRTLIGNIADAAASQKFPLWAGTTKFNDGFVYTSPVGQFRPNNFGLFDTIGNATEWCADWYAADYYANSPASDPRGPAGGTKHVARGGSFTDKCHAADRFYFTTDHRAFDCGFRVVCEIPVKATAAVVAPPAVPGDGRHLWVGKTQFAMIAAGKWSETKPDEPGHSILFFDEAARTPQYVELFDKTRGKAGVRIRLEETQAFILWEGRDKEFKPLKRGQWVTTVDPPPATASAMNDPRHVRTGNSSDPSSDASPNLLVNGSFEDGPPGVGDFMSFHPGSTAITGWMVTRAQIDLIGLGRASQGQRSVDLHGSPGYGGIEQKFKTTKGQRYRVTFALSGNPEARFKVKRIAVEAAGSTGVFTFDSTGTSWDKLRWETKSFDFDATSDETTLEIHTLEKRDPIRGPLIDDVRVASLPRKSGI
jgi:choice-of-anchor C domain-containing protein